MKRNKFALQILVFGFIVLSFIACDKDFNSIQSDVITNENATNFDIFSEKYEIISYTEALGPVQTNNLGLSTLGIYDDAYGRTTSSFVTKVSLSAFDPDFGEDVVIDSVVLKIPYFNFSTGTEEDGNILYEIDSVLPKADTYKSIKLSLFESDFFIRDFDPNADLGESQAYFSNKSASPTEPISDMSLEGEALLFLTGPQTSYTTADNGENVINISDKGFVLEEADNDDEDTDPQILFREAPGIRIKLDPAFWQNKIIDQEGESVLTNANNFDDYFRGLYFKAESVEDDGSFLILNIGGQSSQITIHYTRLTSDSTDDADKKEQTTFEIGFGSDRINFMDNNFTTPINTGDDVDGDSRIYLKGGEGALSKIKLFNGDDNDTSDDTTFEDWKDFFVETDEDGNFVKSKRLLNEASLVFYVDQDMVQDGEPNRLYVYDIDNKTPLIDYFLDELNNSIPSFSIVNHLGPLQRVNDDPTESGVKYKFRITEHLNNLLLRDSTNVELGLSVSLNVNLEGGNQQRQIQNTTNSDLTIPVSSIITPRGTVLHGNNTEDESKRVFLEIYYTEPN
jgi:hypothetical protein